MYSLCCIVPDEEEEDGLKPDIRPLPPPIPTRSMVLPHPLALLSPPPPSPLSPDLLQRDYTLYDKLHQVECRPGKELFLTSHDGVQYNLDRLTDKKSPYYHYFKQIINVNDRDHTEATQEVFREEKIEYRWYQFFDRIDPMEVMNMIAVGLRLVNEPTIKYPCLIHCEMGQSRSVAVAVLVIMTERGCSADEALKRIWAARNVAAPNCGFMDAIRLLSSARRRHEKTRKEAIERKRRGSF